MLLTFDHINKLNQDLRNFGLNPSEWNVLKEKSSTYRIESKHDRQFVFKGKAKRKGPSLKWQQLELVSL